MDSLLMVLNKAQTNLQKLQVLKALSGEAENADIRSAQIYARQALDIAKSMKDEKVMAEYLALVARNEYFLGNYNEALDLYLKALMIYEKLKDPRGLIAVNVNLGAIYDRLSDDERALNYYKQALQDLNTKGKEILEKNPEYKTVLYNNIASLYNKQGDSIRYRQYIDEALKLSLHGKDLKTLGVIYNNLGLQSLEKNNFKQAKLHLQKSIQNRILINDLDGLAKSYHFMTSFYDRINQLDSAEWFARKSLEIAKKIGSLETQMNASRTLWEIYEKQNKHPEALLYHKLYTQFNDSIKNDKIIRQAAQIQANYDFAKFEKKVQFDKQRTNFIYILIIITLLFLIVLAILLLVLRHSHNKRTLLENKQLEDEIHLKNKEFATNVMYLVRKNELLNDVATKLLTIKEKVHPDLRSSLQSIIIDLQNEVDHEIWQEFEFRFQQVHNNFYERLREKHSDLSPSELRICAFLRLNMSSKEIAAITYQNVKSIEVARARIRKKFNLTNTDANLIQYLAEF